jgi:hypothetical protein
LALCLASFGRTGGKFVEGRYYWAIPWAMVLFAGVTIWLVRNWKGVALPLAAGLVGVSAIRSADRTRDWLDAHRLLEKAIEVAPENIQAHAQLAELRAQSGLHTDVMKCHFPARRAFDAMMQVPPESPRQHDLASAYRWLSACEHHCMQSMAHNFPASYSRSYAEECLRKLALDAGRLFTQRQLGSMPQQNLAASLEATLKSKVGRNTPEKAADTPVAQ